MNIHYIKNTLKKNGIEDGQVVDAEKLAQSPIGQELEKLAAAMKPQQLALDSFRVGPALVTVSTVCAYGCYETLVFDHLENELFFSTSSSTEKAMETHRSQCEIYRTQQQKAIRKKQQEERLRRRMEQDPRLSAFSAALRSAASAAVALKLSTDTGTCNFDSPAFDFKAAGLSRKEAEFAIEKAGLRSFVWKCFSSPLLVICGFTHGQAEMRTQMAETFASCLTASGYPCIMYYQMD